MGGLSLPQVGAVLGHHSAQTTLCYADHLLGAVRGYSGQAPHNTFAGGWVCCIQIGGAP
jgi:hypothetical protein